MIARDELLEILKSWNFWEKEIERGIERKEYVEELFNSIERKEILVLKGIRRCGKSTIMRQLMFKLLEKGVEREQIVFINLEDYALKDNLNIKLLKEVLEVYKAYSNNRKKIYFFIDEVQTIEGWERFLRTYYDKGENIKFIVSGSNASILSKELSTLLTGRNLTFQIQPLTLKEYLFFTEKPKIEDYLNYGGFPEVVLEEDSLQKKLILQQYFEDIINKDIIQRFSIRNTQLVFNLARYVLANSSSKLSMHKLSKVFGVGEETISTYLSYLLDAFLIAKVSFFSYSLKDKYSKARLPKYYSSDNGFIMIHSLEFSKDLGRKYENLVFLSIYKEEKEISYWENGGEVDFVYAQTALNVTSTNKIPQREYEGLLSFLQKNRKYTCILLSPEGLSKSDSIKGIPLLDFIENIHNS